MTAASREGAKTQDAALLPLITMDISIKMEVAKAAKLLVTQQGLEVALKTATCAELFEGSVKNFYVEE